MTNYAVCSRRARGPGFEERRDIALLSLMIDTGMRAAEVMNLRN